MVPPFLREVSIIPIDDQSFLEALDCYSKAERLDEGLVLMSPTEILALCAELNERISEVVDFRSCARVRRLSAPRLAGSGATAGRRFRPCRISVPRRL